MITMDMTNFNDKWNDDRYLTMKDWYGTDFITIEKWLYELLFYKKSIFTVTTGSIYDTCGCERTTLYKLRETNKFNCGTTRKRKLLNRWGHTFVEITFRNGKTESLPVDRILTMYGWKYLLFNVRHIMNHETGELVFFVEY